VTRGIDLSMQTYASAVDVEPWNAKLHQQLSKMYHNKGNERLSCAHLWSLVSLAPKDMERSLTLARCLAALPTGREMAQKTLADMVALSPSRQDMSRLTQVLLEIQRGVAKPIPKAEAKGGALNVTASWNQPQDLDLALVTPSGERISALRGGKLASIEVDGRTVGTAELLQSRYLPDGTYRLEIGRAGASPTGLVSGTVLIQAMGKSQVIPFQLSEQSRPVAQIKVNRVYPRYPYYYR
jgi:hypothetical protein